MRTHVRRMAYLLLAQCLMSPAFAVNQIGEVWQVLPPDGRGCFFFTLHGVGQADPVVPGNPWFAVPLTYQGFKELVSMLYMAKAADLTVETVTSGTTACGYATIIYAHAS